MKSARTEIVVEVKHLRRRFGSRWALDGVDLDVRRGEMIGLVGPNGSGKTSLLKIVSGFLKPSSGEVRVFGRVPFRDQAKIMESAHFVFAPPALYESLTAIEHLSQLAFMGKSTALSGLLEILRLVGLRDRAHDRVKTFSFGMRQRLALALALSPLPELLVLDEPTDGLDPLGIVELRGILQRMRKERGMTVLISSHLLSEIENLVDRVLVLDEGHSLFWGKPADMVQEFERIHLKTSDNVTSAQVLSNQGYSVTERSAGVLELPSKGITLEAAQALLREAGVQLTDFHCYQPGFEAAFRERLNRERDVES